MTPVTPLIKEKKTKVFPIFVACTLAFQGALLLILLLQFILLRNLSTRPTPSLVQLLDGRAVQVTESEALERSPETIRRFVNEIMTLTFTWTGTLPPETLEDAKQQLIDPGIPITLDNGRQARVTTSTWQASFGFSEDLRRGFMQTIAELTPISVFNNSQDNQGVFVPGRVGVPEQIAPGEWKVILYSNIVLTSDKDKIGNTLSFNREVYVRAIDPPSLPLEERSTTLERVIYRSRRSGLEIYKITELSQEDF